MKPKRCRGERSKHKDTPAAPLDYESPTANMFGCQPCPECGSKYRWPTQDGLVLCDECGLVQKLPPTEAETA